MVTKLENIKRQLNDENITLDKLLKKSYELDLLIKKQREIVWQKEEELEEEIQNIQFVFMDRTQLF